VSLVPSPEIVRRVTETEGACTWSRLGLLESLPGNPVGVERRRIGAAFAMSARYLPNSSFNRVVALDDADADQVPALVEWFETRGVAGRFEIMPGLPSPKVLAALARCGYAHAEFHAVLYGEPRPDAPPAEGVTVEVVDASTLETFLDTYSAGWGVRDAEGFKNNVRGWLGLPGWRLYLGRFRGEPAGGAILFTKDGVGYCADSAVDPAQRGHGVHQALLRRRSADALAAGCDLLCAQAAYLSTSSRNMVRAGLSLLCTKAIWMRLPDA
jgi:hypothetical protein